MPCTRRPLRALGRSSLPPGPANASSRRRAAIPGVGFISGAHDGTLRIWSLAKGEEPQVLYGLGGYKVWLGSVCTDGRRLVSDGSDNSVVVHDFGAEPEE